MYNRCRIKLHKYPSTDLSNVSLILHNYVQIQLDQLLNHFIPMYQDYIKGRHEYYINITSFYKIITTPSDFYKTSNIVRPCYSVLL